VEPNKKYKKTKKTKQKNKTIKKQNKNKNPPFRKLVGKVEKTN